MNKPSMASTTSVYSCDTRQLESFSNLSDTEFMQKLKELGFPLEAEFSASPNFIHRKISDTDVLISMGSNIANFNGYIELNPSAASLWDQLETPCRFSDLMKKLMDTYHISRETAAADTMEFLELLLQHEMIAVLERGAGPKHTKKYAAMPELFKKHWRDATHYWNFHPVLNSGQLLSKIIIVTFMPFRIL